MKTAFLAGVLGVGLGGLAAASETLVSGFEQDLASAVGDANWVIDPAGNLAVTFTTNGVTEGSYALAVTHSNNWSGTFYLWGNAGNRLIGTIASNDTLKIDITVPTNATWRQIFPIMMGDGLDWTQGFFDLPVGETTTVSWDLVSTGIRNGAANSGGTWWAVGLIFQGGDVDGAETVVTILDNIRFTSIQPNPYPILGARIEGADLVVSWSSEAGEKYDLTYSDDLAAGAWLPAMEGMIGLAGATTVTGTLPGVFAAYRVEWVAPGVLFFDDFEGTDTWTHGVDGDPGTAWERGLPTLGPAATYSGTNAWGTNLDGYITSDADCWLRSPVIDLAGVTTAQLTFQQTRDMEPQFDFAYVNILDPAGAILAAEIVVDSVELETAWSLRKADLPAAALDREIVIEFRFQSDDYNPFNYVGWCIDDVSLIGR